MKAILRHQRLVELGRRIADIEKREFNPLPDTEQIFCGPVPLVCSSVHEFRVQDYRDAPSAAGLMLSLVGKAMVENNQTLIWISRASEAFHEGVPYGSGFAVYGINFERCIFVHAKDIKSALWAAEEAVRFGAIAILEFWQSDSMLDLTVTRRLQLGAEQSGARLFLLRYARDGSPSSARTRWRVRPTASAIDHLDSKGVGRPRWNVELEKSRDGGRGQWVLEWDDANKQLIEITPHSCHLVSAMANGLFKEEKAVA